MKKHYLKYSLILSGICMLYFVTTNILGVSGTEVAGWSGYIPYIIVIYYGHKKGEEFFQSYGSRFLFGLVVTVSAAFLSSLFMYAYLIWVDDLMVRTVIENQIAQIDPNDPNYAQLVENTKNSLSPIAYLKFGTIVGSILGVIISAITSIFTGKKRVQNE